MESGDALSRQWTWCGPDEVEVDGETRYRMTIEELPGFAILGATPNEVIDRLVPALRQYLADNEPPS